MNGIPNRPMRFPTAIFWSEEIIVNGRVVDQSRGWLQRGRVGYFKLSSHATEILLRRGSSHRGGGGSFFPRWAMAADWQQERSGHECGIPWPDLPVRPWADRHPSAAGIFLVPRTPDRHLGPRGPRESACPPHGEPDGAAAPVGGRKAHRDADEGLVGGDGRASIQQRSQTVRRRQVARSL